MKRFFGVLALLALTGLVGCASGSDVVSKAEYDQISEGMYYSQVVSIVGQGGTELSSGTMEGVPGVMPSITTKMYMWQNSDGSNMTAMFQNYKLINKAQFGLK
ncbi:MAG: hypothetical protein K6360_07370 [Deltaproteobacteria bacterium]